MNRFDLRFRFLFCSFLLLAASTKAAELQPLPFPKIIQSKAATAENAVERMVSETNVSEYEVETLKKFIEEGDPLGKRIVLVRDKIEKTSVFDLLLAAKEKGIRVTVITDANPSLEYAYKRGQKTTTRFAHARFRKSAMASGLSKLIENGFRWNEGDFRIVSQPLFNPVEAPVFPMMNEKGMLLDNGEKSVLIRGTANLSSLDRYDRVYEYRDPEFIAPYRDHYRILADTFARGGSIRDLPAEAPTRIIYADGSSVEIAFANGRFDPNTRVSEILKRAIVSGLEIEKIVMTELAFTDPSITRSLRQLHALGKAPKVVGIFDSKYAALDGYGQPALLSGFNTIVDRGNAGAGFTAEEAAKNEIYVYQKAATDPQTGLPVQETTLDGAPVARSLMHDKSILVHTRERGVQRAYFFTGSLPLGARFENADEQLAYLLPPNSWLVREYEKSVDRLLRDSPAVTELSIGEVRSLISSITGHSELEVPIDVAKRVLEASAEEDGASRIGKAMNEVLELPSAIENRPPKHYARARIRRVEAFLAWYFPSDIAKKHRRGDARDPFRKVASLLPKVASFDNDAWAFIRQLNLLSADPNLPPEERLRRQQQAINEVWKAMKLPGAPIEIGEVGTAAYANSNSGYRNVTINFDIDDNLLFLPTRARLFRKEGADPKLAPHVDITTGEFATERSHIGIDGRYKNYEIVVDDTRNTFERTSTPKSGRQRNYFLEDLKSAIDGGFWEETKGPMWSQLEYATQTPESAKIAYVITARRHDPKDVYEALKYLVQIGKLKNAIPIENIYCVGNTQNPSQEKAKIMLRQLHALASLKAPSGSKLVLDPDGSRLGKYHVWAFSDDDWGNFVAARTAISEEFKAGRVTNTKVMLFYTGHGSDPALPQSRPQAIVIKSDGGIRNLRFNEEQEIAKLMRIGGEDCSELLRYLIPSSKAVFDSPK